jgi:dTMP kinase
VIKSTWLIKYSIERSNIMSKIFVFDGTDGSGKKTQIDLICRKFDEENIPYLKMAFPRYESQSSSLVKMYLGGELGDDPKAISPYSASLFYSVDRFASYIQVMKPAIDEGKTILLDRYTTANMIHQGGKISDLAERNKFFNWLWDLEFNVLGLPVPDRVFFFDMPTEYAIKLMENRLNKITGEKEKDIHEKNVDHLKAAYESGCYMVEKYNWDRINCVKNGEIRSIEDIHDEVYSKIRKEIS